MRGRRVRPHVELCRLYMRLNNPTAAREHGRTALTEFRRMGAPAGEAQALFCLTESLRRGSESDRAEALNDAQVALKALEPLNYRDNLARAYHYLALAFEAQGMGKAEIRLDDRDAEQNAIADALITYLVRFDLADSRSEETEAGHYDYFISVDWDRLYRTAEAAGVDLPAALARAATIPGG